VYLDTRPLREALLSLLPANVPPKARPYLPLIEGMVPELGGYGSAIVADEAELRLEAYGDVPAAYGFFSVVALGGAIESQKRAAAPQPSPAPDAQ
jgi:hypothetical protein